MKTIQNEIEKRTISPEASIIEAMKQMDVVDKKLLLVLNKNEFIGLLSIGDIQRAIISGFHLNQSIFQILRKNIKVTYEGESIEIIKAKMFEARMELMPMLDNKNQLSKVFFWEELFPINERIIRAKLVLPIVIMAGGKGARLKPITNILPKPLIPIGEKTIMEQIMDNFLKIGCDEFHVSVNYKADMIKYYFKNLNNPLYHIAYFQEDKPLGTAGSLSLLNGKINTTFFVTNCDIIIEEDYNEIYKYHCENNNELTVIAALKQYKIPYGTIESKENGILTKINEKPELTIKINSGMYILEPHLLNEIPKDHFFHITHLIEVITKRGGKVGVFPITEKSWKDIGEWDEYLKNTQ